MQEVKKEIKEELQNSDDSISEYESEKEIDESSTYPFTAISCFCEKLYGKKNYILNLSASSDSDPNVAIALANCSVQVLKLQNDFEDISTLNSLGRRTVELKFVSDNLLWAATHEGTVSLWDLRVPKKPVATFTDPTDEKKNKDRKFNTFDVSPNGRLLCAGTDDFEGDSYLLFWDVRKNSLAGGFWESHTDDITQVRFHPTDSNKLMSGSTDGLINIYDLTQTSEDDALIDTLNTESSIEKLVWYKNEKQAVIGCITHTADVQFWKEEDVQPFCKFTRSNVAEYLMKLPEQSFYVADIHASRKSCITLAGSINCARGLNLENNLLTPAFELVQNKQRIRSSFYNENTRLLITGGEGGRLNAWRIPKEEL